MATESRSGLIIPRSVPNIPIAKPWFGPEELAAVTTPLESGWVVQGPFVREFEEKFLKPVEKDLKTATAAMDQMAVLLHAARNECS